MLDDGCRVEGYTSDITRTFVLGKPTDKMNKVFEIVQRAQKAALEASKPGRRQRRGADAALRWKVIVDAGYGPGSVPAPIASAMGSAWKCMEWSYLVKNDMYGWPPHPTLHSPAWYSATSREFIFVGSLAFAWADAYRAGCAELLALAARRSSISSAEP